MAVIGRWTTETEVLDDVAEALRRVTVAQERVIVSQRGEPVAAIIPLEDLRLLQVLEEEELDRIDIEEIRKGRLDPDNQVAIPLEQVKAELGL